MARKTVDLDVLLYHANFALRNPHLSQDEKKGVCGMIETALHSAGAYKGFSYLGHPHATFENNKGEYSRRYFGNEATPSRAI